MKTTAKLLCTCIYAALAISCAQTHKLGNKKYKVVTVKNTERNRTLDRMILKGWRVDSYRDITAEGSDSYGFTSYTFIREDN
jgi:hypothetical protein